MTGGDGLSPVAEPVPPPPYGPHAARGNTNHFLIATQDRELRRRLMAMPGAAVIFATANGIHLEPPSGTQQAAAGDKSSKARAVAPAEREVLQHLGAGDEDGEAPAGKSPFKCVPRDLLDKEGGASADSSNLGVAGWGNVPMPSIIPARRRPALRLSSCGGHEQCWGSGQDTRPTSRLRGSSPLHSPRLHRRRKAKGPNPLAIKSKQKKAPAAGGRTQPADNGPAAGTEAPKTGVKKKRVRRSRVGEAGSAGASEEP